MPELKAYFSIGNTMSAQWSNDHSIVYISADAKGTSLMQTDLCTGGDILLFQTKESIRGLHVALETGDIFFGLDDGGTENLQVYRLAKGAGAPAPLTRRPEVMHLIGGLLADNKTLAVSCNARVRGTFDIMGIDIFTGESRMIVHNSDNYNMPAGLSPDRRFLMVNKLMGVSNNPLWMVDTQTGSVQKAPDLDVEAAYSSVAWKHDGSGFYMISDADADFAYVAYYDLASKTYQKRFAYDWDVSNLALSHDDRYLAICTNEGGYSDLKIYDLVNEAYLNTPKPPKGVISEYLPIFWAPGAAKLLFNVSGAARPMDYWVLDIMSDSLEKVTHSDMAGLTADDFVQPRLCSFRSFDGLEIPYFLYAPKGMHENMPVMLEIHGGPEGQSVPGIAYKELLHYMVSQGIAVAEPNVRGSTGYGKMYTHLDDVEKRLDSVEDIACLIDHLVKTGVADPQKIGVMGVSYGGFMTLSCAARMPERLCCSVCTVGMFNLVTFLENTADYRRPHRESEYGTLANDRQTLCNVSPIAKVDDITGPLMIIHGKNDPRVPVSEAYQAREYLHKRGVDIELLIYDDEGHGLHKLDNKLDCYPKVMRFVKKHMKID